MFMEIMLGSMVFLLGAGLLLWRRYLPARWRKHPPAADFNRLSDVVKSAEVANEGFFRALELVQKNLEALIARAENTEQRLRGMVLHPGIDRREQYTAAALLLAEGQEVERVASMLNLPHAQVHLIRELQQVTAREKRVNTPRRREEPAAVGESAQPRRNAEPAAVEKFVWSQHTEQPAAAASALPQPREEAAPAEGARPRRSEKRATVGESARPRRSEEPAAIGENVRPTKVAAPREKAAARPIIWEDTIRSGPDLPLGMRRKDLEP